MPYDKKSFILGLTTGLATRGVLRNPAKEEQQEGPYLTFSSPEPFTLAVANATKNWDGTLEYSTDTTTWIVWDGTTTLASGTENKLYLRGSGNTVITGLAMNRRIVLTGTEIACDGDIRFLLNYQDVAESTMGAGCFYCLFYGCTALIKAPDLPSMNLSASCYNGMFSKCSELKYAPELPATSLAPNCYYSMFSLCTSIKAAPELPATQLAQWCYSEMFARCYALTQVSDLPAQILDTNCYYQMFALCSSLESAPSIFATTLATGCCREMFRYCTKLKSIPKLPVKQLATQCYANMFQYCSEIKLSASQTGEYQTPYRIPISGYGYDAKFSRGGMFANTGGTFTGTPTINTTYYTSNEVV